MKWLGPILLVLVGIAAVVIFLDHQRIRNYGMAHSMGQAREDLRAISTAIRRVELEDPGSIAKLPLSALKTEDVYFLLSRTNLGMPILNSCRDWDVAHQLLDPWRHPYKIKAVTVVTRDVADSQKNKVRFTIWSGGPNGEDENCLGDDIGPEIVEVDTKTP